MTYNLNKDKWPYFCFSGPSTQQTTSVNNIAASTTFFGTNLESSYTPYTPFTNCIFTAPEKGLYYFEISLNCVNNGNRGDDSGNFGLLIKKGTTTTSRVVLDNPSWHSTTSSPVTNIFTTIASLNVNDTVKMYSDNFDDFQTYPVNQCYFMGYMIAAFV